MRREVLNVLTSQDIDEIFDAMRSLNKDKDIIPTAEDILHALLEKHQSPPSIGERFPIVLHRAEVANGMKLSRSRCKENTTLRAMVAYLLHLEGYGYTEIGRMLQRDHSTVIHLCDKMRDMLSVPYAYREEVAKWKEFKRLLDQPLQLSHPNSQTTSASALAESPAK